MARKSTVQIAATASDASGVQKVEFYVNGSLACSDTSASYSCTFKVSAARGKTYDIQAKAYDRFGNTGTSSPIRVTGL